MNKICAISLIMFSLCVRAEVYKWTDEKGNVHYGDKPQSKNNSVEIRVDTRPTNFGGEDVSREEKRQKVLESLEEDRLEKQEARKKKQAKREKNRKKCHRLKDRMKHFKRARGLYNLDKNGNRVYLSNDKRKKSEAGLQKQINKYCR